MSFAEWNMQLRSRFQIDRTSVVYVSSKLHFFPIVVTVIACASLVQVDKIKDNDLLRYALRRTTIHGATVHYFSIILLAREIIIL